MVCRFATAKRIEFRVSFRFHGPKIKKTQTLREKMFFIIIYCLLCSMRTEHYCFNRFAVKLKKKTTRDNEKSYKTHVANFFIDICYVLCGYLYIICLIVIIIVIVVDVFFVIGKYINTNFEMAYSHSMGSIAFALFAKCNFKAVAVYFIIYLKHNVKEI